ncbi:MAG: autotransporter domain-containing protein [Alphaproteobacteria bacterium]|nr:autotransporter domain-containing protein [Alphaproteobacteria bacterium]
MFKKILLGISVLPVLAIMPAVAVEITERIVLDTDTTLTGISATNIDASDSWGAAYYIESGNIVIDNSIFSGNTADTSGAIELQGPKTGTATTLTITNSAFNGNTALTSSGAIETWTRMNLLHIDNSSFTGNTALAYGAISVFGKAGVNQILNSAFTENSATETESGVDADGGDGGAIFLGSEAKLLVDNVTFTGNTAANDGGAIATRSEKQAQTTSGLEIQNSKFYRNIADGRGGAIYANISHNTNLDGAAQISNSTFVENSANQGGAIYNDFKDSANTVSNLQIVDSSFTSNTATTSGGAIYNAGNLTFAGVNNFTGNIAGGVANDVYNSGTILFAEDSVTTMDGGVNGDGTMCIDTGATLNLGTASIVQSGLTLDGTLNAVLKNADEFASFNITSLFDGDGILNLDLRGAGEYTVFQGEVFDNENVTVSSTVFDYDWNDDFDTITVTLKSVEDIASENGLSGDSAQTVANLVNSSSEKLNEFANVIQDSLANGDTDAVEHVYRAIHPETESVVQSVNVSMQNAIANLVAGRMSFGRVIGRSGGATPARNGVWVEGLYNKSKHNDAFNGYTRGIVAGIDTQITRGLMLGIGYSYAHSDVSATARNTEIDSNTIFAYGQYKPAAWYVNAMLNYTMSDYSEKSDVLGVAINSDFDVDAFGGAVMTGYDFVGGITPEIGMRYMHISADEYENSLGVKSKLDDADYLTGVLGAKYAFDYRVSRGFTLRPELRGAVKYDMLSDKQVATITMPGINSYVLNGNRLSRMGAEFGAGLVMKYQDFSLALNYDIEMREDYTSQTGRVRARYVF